MTERHLVETAYRGERCLGQWWVEDGQLHVENEFGSLSGSPVGRNPRAIALPSEAAERLLWQLLRKQDPNRPFFSWG
jgi:hypothetical protein